MVGFERFHLDNGLKVLVHRDPASTMAAVNLIYDVGARDEDPEQTGFAHLFEHLMFEGSENIPSYDEPLQRAGGESNAFTTNDITNYYLTVPAHNLETGFWLESDRMLQLAFSEEALAVQKSVVIEEYKQRYVNQPYGDIWMHLRPLAYKRHPYRWPTIGKDMAHVEGASLDAVRAFFNRYYHPGNAVLTVAGNVDAAHVRSLAEKWFGPIPGREVHPRNLPVEPPQHEARQLTLERDVPQDALYLTFPMGGRKAADYPAIDLLSDVLSRGKSSRLYHQLVKEQTLFSEIGAFVTGSFDPGLLVVGGKLGAGISMDEAEAAIWKELHRLQETAVRTEELEKVQNKVVSTLAFSELSALDKATNLAVYELLGDAEGLNREAGRYRAVQTNELVEAARTTFRAEACSTLYYRKLNG